MKWIKLFENFNIKYYRAVTSFIGNELEFIPNDYYECIGANNEPKYYYGVMAVSDIMEICGSKYIGGAVLGSLSMFINNHAKKLDGIYIYEIEEKPDKDISHWSLQDFEYLQEVRWRRPVKGIYIGKVILTDEQLGLIKLYYEYMSSIENEEEYDERFDKIVDLLENGQFQKILDSIQIKYSAN